VRDFLTNVAAGHRPEGGSRKKIEGRRGPRRP
jgi:hypothetical protein